jgi:hypothetical protein
MAVLVELKTRCQVEDCINLQVVELRDWNGEHRGKFCRVCGEKKLAEMEKYEKENPQDR